MLAKICELLCWGEWQVNVLMLSHCTAGGQFTLFVQDEDIQVRT